MLLFNIPVCFLNPISESIFVCQISLTFLDFWTFSFKTLFQVSYAGYEMEEEVPDPDGAGMKKVIKKTGDQGNLEFTQVI